MGSYFERLPSAPCTYTLIDGGLSRLGLVASRMPHFDPDPPIGAVLRQLRQARGFTIEEAAERGRMAANYLGEVERGNRNPTLKVVARLLAALRITWAEFGAAIDAGTPDAGQRTTRHS